MEKRKGLPGAPKKKESERKQSMTCSVSPVTSEKAIKHFKSRGRAIELAVKYHKHILQMEKDSANTDDE